jgi:hypothetical protein
MTLQETKFTSKKSPNYLQRLFFQYKLMFNNTHTTTQYNQQPGVPHTLTPKMSLCFIQFYSMHRNLKMSGQNPNE